MTYKKRSSGGMEDKKRMEPVVRGDGKCFGLEQEPVERWSVANLEPVTRGDGKYTGGPSTLMLSALAGDKAAQSVIAGFLPAEQPYYEARNERKQHAH
jgi:hypothetical protein